MEIIIKDYNHPHGCGAQKTYLDPNEVCGNPARFKIILPHKAKRGDADVGYVCRGCISGVIEGLLLPKED